MDFTTPSIRRNASLNLNRDPVSGFFHCPSCSYKSPYRSTLKLHMTKHSDDKPYSCDQCPYSAKRMSYLNQHQALRHMDSPASPSTPPERSGFENYGCDAELDLEANGDNAQGFDNQFDGKFVSQGELRPKLGSVLNQVGESSGDCLVVRPLGPVYYCAAHTDGKPKIDANHRIDTRPTIDANPTVGSKPKIDANPSTGTRPKIDANHRIDTRPTIDANPTVDSKPKIDANPSTETRPKIDANPSTETRPKIDANPSTETRPKIDGNPTIDARPQIDARPSTAAEPQIDVKPDVDAIDVKPDVDAIDVKPNVDAIDVKPNVDAIDVKPNVDAIDVQPSTASRVNPPKQEQEDSKNEPVQPNPPLESPPSLDNPSTSAQITFNTLAGNLAILVRQHLSSASQTSLKRPALDSDQPNTRPEKKYPRLSQKIHGSTGSQTRSSWRCAHCDIAFYDSALYVIHIGLHDQDDPWKCNLCGEKLHDVYSFTSHFL